VQTTPAIIIAGGIVTANKLLPVLSTPSLGFVPDFRQLHDTGNQFVAGNNYTADNL
jgi:hypothetical protein